MAAENKKSNKTLIIVLILAFGLIIYFLFFGGKKTLAKLTAKKQTFKDTQFKDGHVGLLTDLPHDVKVGDMVSVNKTDKTLNPEYDGEAKVLEVINPNLFIIEKGWGKNSTMEGGYFQKI